MTRKDYYIWLVKCMGIGNIRSHTILEKYDDIAEFYEDCHNKSIKKGIRLTESELRFLSSTTLSDIQYVYEKYSKFKPQIITIEDENYPWQLKNIDNPPIVLFVVGDISHLDDELLIAVVGSRKETLYGKRVNEVICSELCVSGFSIVSGLANGGDTTAHITALKCGARTYGFLACGLDVDYPYNKGKLKNAIVRNGAIITEYLPQTPAYPENFHVRNRLMSGISEGVLVIEAAKTSGTLITAHNAVNQGKDVFAVPASIFWPNSAGVLQLIKEGAKPVKDALDIIEDYLTRFPNKINIPDEKLNLKEIYEINCKLGLSDPNSLNAVNAEYKEKKKLAKNELKEAGKELIKTRKEKEILSDIEPLHERLERNGLNKDENIMKVVSCIENNSQTMDEIAEKSGLSLSKILVLVTKLEMSGIVKKLPGNRIEII